MNTWLNRPFTIEEVGSALRSMSPLKATGADNLGAVFYQHFRHIVGSDVACYCFGLLQGDFSLSDVNHTNIVLIPKIKKIPFI